MALPAIILTGASGLVGRGFLQACQSRYRIYAIALAIDGVQDAYESFEAAAVPGSAEPLRTMATANARNLEEIVSEPNAFYRPIAKQDRPERRT